MMGDGYALFNVFIMNSDVAEKYSGVLNFRWISIDLGIFAFLCFFNTNGFIWELNGSMVINTYCVHSVRIIRP